MLLQTLTAVKLLASVTASRIIIWIIIRSDRAAGVIIDGRGETSTISTLNLSGSAGCKKQDNKIQLFMH